MIIQGQGTVASLGTGVRADHISGRSLIDKTPEANQVSASQLRDFPANSGLFNCLFALNFQNFRHAQAPHVPCDIESGATYDSSKKVLYRQHLSFWREQSYSLNTVATVPLMAHSMPQIHQQTAVMCSYIHLFTAIWNDASYFNSTSGFRSPETAFPDSYMPIRSPALSVVSETTSEAGDQIARYQNSALGSLMTEAKQITPSTRQAIGRSGYFSRWWPPVTDESGTVTSFDPSPQLWNDVLADHQIAGSRSQYGYGNTSNAGLSSYGYYAFRTDRVPAPQGLSCDMQSIPVFEAMDPVNYPDLEGYNEPRTDPGAGTDINRGTNPSLNTTVATIAANIPMFNDGTNLWGRVNSSGSFVRPSTVTIVHRIQDLRVGYYHLIDSTYAAPDSEPQI